MEHRYNYQGRDYSIQLEPGKDGHFTAQIGDRRYDLDVEHRDDGEIILIIAGLRVRAHLATSPGGEIWVALTGPEASVYELARAEGHIARRGRSGGGQGGLAAQMPGQVRQVFVVEGERVERGQTLLLLEAMKMEIRVAAPHDGVVARLLIKVGDSVERGQALAEVTSHTE